jgi:hypothetical protein
MPGRGAAAAAGAAGAAAAAGAAVDAAGAAGAWAAAGAGLAGALLKFEVVDLPPPMRLACATEGTARETTVTAITAMAVERMWEEMRMVFVVLELARKTGCLSRALNLSLVMDRKKKKI